MLWRAPNVLLTGVNEVLRATLAVMQLWKAAELHKTFSDACRLGGGRKNPLELTLVFGPDRFPEHSETAAFPPRGINLWMFCRKRLKLQTYMSPHSWLQTSFWRWAPPGPKKPAAGRGGLMQSGRDKQGHADSPAETADFLHFFNVFFGSCYYCNRKMRGGLLRKSCEAGAHSCFRPNPTYYFSPREGRGWRRAWTHAGARIRRGGLGWYEVTMRLLFYGLSYGPVYSWITELPLRRKPAVQTTPDKRSVWLLAAQTRKPSALFLTLLPQWDTNKEILGGKTFLQYTSSWF